MRNQQTLKVSNEVYRQVMRKYGNWVQNINVTINGEKIDYNEGQIRILQKGTVRLTGMVRNVQILQKILELVRLNCDGRAIVNNLQVKK